MNKLKVLMVIAAVLWSLLLIGCGGGGDSSGSGSLATNTSSTNDGNSNSGGDANSADGNSEGSSDSEQSTSFAELEVDTGFDWQMAAGADLSFELVSLISQGQVSTMRNQNERLSISGRYVVSVFAIDDEGNVLSNAIFTGMTNQFGQLAVNFTLMEEWLGVVVDVTIVGVSTGEQSCSQSIYKDELSDVVQLGCDIAVGSDL